MKIRICSDLHIDVNKTKEFGFDKKLDEVDLNIIAGDIAGDYRYEINYLSQLESEKPVVCVGGNHLGYNYNLIDNRTNIKDCTKEDCIEKLVRCFNGRNGKPIHYLENSTTLVNGKIIFGGTMYTDYNLYSDPDYSKHQAVMYMNDFRNVYTYDERLRNITPEDYVMWFNHFKESLKNHIEIARIDGRDIIVVTHFAPSVKSISEKYNGKYRILNPRYASNLEQFILANPCIKLWVHGHMHDSFDYQIGNCRVVCEPYGYSYEQNKVPEEYNGKVIEI